MFNSARFQTIAKNKFVVSSGIVLVGSTIANVLNYLFNLVMGRMLDPVAYGEIAALVTLAMIVVVPAGTLAILVTKFISQYTASGHSFLVRKIYRSANHYALTGGIILLLVFLLFSGVLAKYFKLEQAAVVIFAFIMPVGLIGSVTKGALQGLHDFKSTSISNILEAASKLIISAGLVYWAFGIKGAVLGIVLGSFLSYLYGAYRVRRDLPADTEGPQEPEPLKLTRFALLVFMATLCLSVFGNIDVVLAKHYLPDLDAGQYAALAVLGRIITYASVAVITVLLPMVSASKDARQGQKFLKISLAITLLVSGVILCFFFFAPNFTINLLFGREYLDVAKFLGWFGLVMLLGSLSKIFVNYFIARHQSFFIYPFALAVILQVTIIVMYHNSIQQILYNLILTNILLLASMVAVYLFAHKEKQLDPEAVEEVNVT